MTDLRAYAVFIAAVATIGMTEDTRMMPGRPISPPSGDPRTREALMIDKPPLLPVLVGVGSIGLGLLNGLFFGVWASTALLGHREDAPPVVPGLLLLMDAFALLQVPAGIGILLHRPWGKQLAQALAFGTIITGLLGGGLGILGMGGFPDVVMATFAWGFATGLAWGIALNVAFRFRSMKASFGEAAPRDAPDAPPP